MTLIRYSLGLRIAPGIEYRLLPPRGAGSCSDHRQVGSVFSHLASCYQAIISGGNFAVGFGDAARTCDLPALLPVQHWPAGWRKWRLAERCP